jgi:hypothetical protein
MRSLLLDYGQREWANFDFKGQAALIDENLGTVVRASINVMRGVNHAMATVLFDVMSGSLPEAKAVLMVNTAIADALLMIGVAVARALCDARIDERALQPLLLGVPRLPRFEPIYAAQLSEALLPIIRRVAASDELRAQLLSQPHIARVEPNSMVRAVQDLYNLSHFLKSPLGLFIQSKSAKFTTVFVQPTSVPENIDLFESARQLALMLWTLAEADLGADAYEIADVAATHYELQLAAVDEPWLTQIALESFRKLAAVSQPAIEFMKQGHDLADFLNAGDPLQEMALSLLQWNGDLPTAAALLTLDVMDEKQKKAIVKGHGEMIDHQLRGLVGPLAFENIDQAHTVFKIWSMAVVSFAPADTAADIRAKMAEIGRMLAQLYGDAEMPEDERREGCVWVRNAIRPFLALGEEEESVDIIKQFLSAADDPSGSKSYEVGFNLEPSDLSVPVSILKRLAGLLRAFHRERRKTS